VVTITTLPGTISRGFGASFWLAVIAVVVVALLATVAGWWASRRRQRARGRHR
jgi:ABC-type spermidine/putrescine transport system permease subunit II